VKDPAFHTTCVGVLLVGLNSKKYSDTTSTANTKGHTHKHTKRIYFLE
jgi:hypothetical protein